MLLFLKEWEGSDWFDHNERCQRIYSCSITVGGKERISEVGNAFSITTGIVLILASMIFRYGAELEQKLHDKIENEKAQ